MNVGRVRAWSAVVFATSMLLGTAGIAALAFMVVVLHVGWGPG